MNFHFKTDFLFYKNTQNVAKSLALKILKKLRSLGFSSPDLEVKKTVINSSRANLLLDLLTFFFKTTTEYFLQPPLFICTFHRCILPTGEKIC